MGRGAGGAAGRGVGRGATYAGQGLPGRFDRRTATYVTGGSDQDWEMYEQNTVGYNRRDYYNIEGERLGTREISAVQLRDGTWSATFIEQLRGRPGTSDTIPDYTSMNGIRASWSGFRRAAVPGGGQGRREAVIMPPEE